MQLTQLPSVIPTLANPFGQPDPRWLTKDTLGVVLRTLTGVEAKVTVPGSVKNPTTCRHLCEHIVTLHRQVITGSVQFTRRALDTLVPNRRLGRVERTRQARALLRARLERLYDLLEPHAA